MIFSEAVVVALITGFFSFLGAMIVNNKQQGIIITKIENLENSVEKHNKVIERTYKLESDTATAFHRIDELREDIKEIEDKL